jgi:hypothetical protein
MFRPRQELALNCALVYFAYVCLSDCKECITFLGLYYIVCRIFNDAVDLGRSIFVIGA